MLFESVKYMSLQEGGARFASFRADVIGHCLELAERTRVDMTRVVVLQRGSELRLEMNHLMTQRNWAFLDPMSTFRKSTPDIRS